MSYWLLFILLATAVVGAAAWIAYGSAVRVQTEPASVPRTRISEVPKEYWAELARQRIFFGHHSVGFDLVEGIRDLMKEHPEVKLNLVETTNATAFDQPVFAHGRVGRNGDPVSKIDGFRSVMESGVGAKADLAFFKFCYVDLDAGTDAEKLQARYAATMEALAQQFPNVQFLHVTAPVMSIRRASPTSPKRFGKVLLGDADHWDDQLGRDRYNARLRAACSDKTNLFDLAFWESVSPDGQRSFRTRGGQKIFVLTPAFTSDGGHLNELGRKQAAEQLLVVLAQAAHESRPARLPR